MQGSRRHCGAVEGLICFGIRTASGTANRYAIGPFDTRRWSAEESQKTLATTTAARTRASETPVTKPRESLPAQMRSAEKSQATPVQPMQGHLRSVVYPVHSPKGTGLPLPLTQLRCRANVLVRRLLRCIPIQTASPQER